MTDTRRFVRSRRRQGHLGRFTLHAEKDGQPFCGVTLKDPVVMDVTAEEFRNMIDESGYGRDYVMCWPCRNAGVKIPRTEATWQWADDT